MRTHELAIAIAACVIASCRDEVGEIERAIASRPTGASVPSASIGGAIDEATGLPVGYPTSLAIVPGFRIGSGGVDPGVVRTATLFYDELDEAQYRAALEAAMTAKGQRIERDVPTSTGSHQLRLAIGDAHASAIVSTETGRVRVDFMMMERPPRQ